MSDSKDNSRGSITYTARNVPDGGWGWVVVIATLSFNIIYDGCSYSFGIIYSDLLDYFGDTRSNTAWIGSLFFAVPLLCAPLAGFITRRLGSRTATMLGGLIAAAGFAAGAFVNSVWLLIFFYGLVGGFGMSLPYFNSLKVVTDYFDKRLASASGIAESGAGLGTVIFAPFIDFLVHNYGWRGTLLILSGVVANIIVCGALYRPLHKSFSGCDISLVIDEQSAGSTSTQIPVEEAVNCLLNQTSADLPRENSDSKESDQCTYKHHLKNIPFIVFAISNFVMYFWYDVPYVFMVDRALSVGLGAREAAYLLSIIGFVHLFSILAYGFLGDKAWVNRAILYGVSTALCGLSVLLVPLCKHYALLAILSGCFGLFSASTEALLSCVLIDIVGKDAFDSMFCGLVLFLEGIANLIGPPIAGLLFDQTGTYDVTFYVAGSCVLAAGCLYISLTKQVKTLAVSKVPVI